MSKDWCSTHQINYSGPECPMCRNDDMAENIRNLSETLSESLSERDSGNAAELEELREQISEMSYNQFNPGIHKCPHCLYKTLNYEASRCPICHAGIDDSYWDKVDRIREEEERLKQEREEADKRAKEEAIKRQQALAAKEEEERRRFQQQESEFYTAVLGFAFLMIFVLGSIFGVIYLAESFYEKVTGKKVGNYFSASVEKVNLPAESPKETPPPENISPITVSAPTPVIRSPLGYLEKDICIYIDCSLLNTDRVITRNVRGFDRTPDHFGLMKLVLKGWVTVPADTKLKMISAMSISREHRGVVGIETRYRIPYVNPPDLRLGQTVSIYNSLDGNCYKAWIEDRFFDICGLVGARPEPREELWIQVELSDYSRLWVLLNESSAAFTGQKTPEDVPIENIPEYNLENIMNPSEKPAEIEDTIR